MAKKESKRARRGKTVAAVTLGAAAAAVAGVAVAKMRSTGGATVLHVRSGEEGWELTGTGDGRGRESFETKQRAVVAGRHRAKELAPAELVIHRQDGSVQRRHRYSS